MALVQNPRITLEDLQRRLAEADSSVMLVEPRILRRVIKNDRRTTGFGLHVPHHMSYTITSDRLLMIVERSELDLSPSADLPNTVILLARPSEEGDLANVSVEEALHSYWRLLFHSRVHVELDRLVSEGQLNEELIKARIREIGTTEFAEIQSVLIREEMLLPPRTSREAYIEFAAVFLELRYFAREHLAWYFPCLRDTSRIESLLRRDVDHGELFAVTRVRGATLQLGRSDDVHHERMHFGEEQLPADPLQPSPPVFWRLLARAERAGTLGNRVKAAILRTKAARIALPDRVADTRASARAEMEKLVDRLQKVLGFSEVEAQPWVVSLEAMLPRAARGFWSAEARLLYDLQNVCVEHERSVYTLDLVEWARSLGKVPIRRQLPLLREVLIAKHLRTASRRLSAIRLSLAHRERLQQFLLAGEAQVEEQMRNRIRPRILEVLDGVGLIPQNVPEKVARNKLVEELLDRIADRGFVNMGDLRDALSQNNLKLQDLTGVLELLEGDPLLRADSELARDLDGVYRRGAIYLRWPQRLSSLAFGTRLGRFLTSYVVLPYGGAFLTIEFLKHLVHQFSGTQEVTESSPASEVVPAGPQTIPTETVWLGFSVVMLGTFVWLLLHHVGFRKRCWELTTLALRELRRALIDWPTQLLQSPLLQRVWQSQWYRVLRSYVIKPAFYAVLLLLPTLITGRRLQWVGLMNVFLAMNLFLNSPIGRYADEWLTDVIVRGWREFRARVFAAAVRFVIDVFQQVLEGLERVLYTVDEWLRFRRGERRVMLAAKAVLGVVWFLVTYVIRFCVTLLIEPQVNPIKHFPVVTVSHKILLPWMPTLAAYLETFLSKFMAGTIATAIVLVLPGVCGFLVWELKENWRLYAANRQRRLTPTIVGSHGETFVRLLRPGFHSGTMPKLYAKLRRAARRARGASNANPILHHLATLHHYETNVQRFVERELLALLQESHSWSGLAVSVAHSRLATNRIEVELVNPSSGGESTYLVFEDRDGWLLAYLRDVGWLSQLDDQQRQVLAVCLIGLYKRAGVNLVVQQIVSNFQRQAVEIEVSSHSIRLFAIPLENSEASYALKGEQTWVSPITMDSDGRWPTIDRKEFMFDMLDIEWVEWVQFWQDEQSGKAHNSWLRPDQLLPNRTIEHTAELPI